MITLNAHILTLSADSADEVIARLDSPAKGKSELEEGDRSTPPSTKTVMHDLAYELWTMAI